MKLTHSYASALSSMVSPVKPAVLKQQQLRLVNRPLAAQLGLPEAWWTDNHITTLLADESSALCESAVAQKYGGHQFGQWNPFLGDGRGLLLAEAVDTEGKATDLHLKGAGPTPYSRGADGRAVLRSTIREYVGGEALHALGIPSSRSLCLFSSAETVFREQPEQGAMMIRTCPSHLRFGHFEYFFHSGEKDKLNALFDYTLATHFPECLDAANPHQALLTAITLRTARLIALWQTHGFVHGVMNTDNMSVHGITFDYGPYAFMDGFKADAVFNHSDHQGRYAFDQQPGIGLWNLNVLAHCFSDHCSVDEIRSALQRYEPAFINQFGDAMCRRMGLDSASPSSMPVVNQWLNMLEQQQSDYTYSFRKLALTNLSDSRCPLRDDFVDRETFDNWWQNYRSLRFEQSTQPEDIRPFNPAVIPRTHLLQQAIEDAESGDFTTCEQLLEACISPFDTRWDSHPFSTPSKQTRGGMLSCSS